MKANNIPIILHPNNTLQDVEKKENKKLNELAKLFLRKKKAANKTMHILQTGEIYIQ